MLTFNKDVRSHNRDIIQSVCTILLEQVKLTDSIFNIKHLNQLRQIRTGKKCRTITTN